MFFGLLNGKNFTGTTGNEAKIMNRADKDKEVVINNPTSFRTYQNVGQRSLSEDDIDVGLTSGRAAEMPSTAIKTARYDPKDDSLNITYRNGNGKEYKFKAGGKEGLAEWINAPSKGQITQEWKSTHRYPGY